MPKLAIKGHPEKGNEVIERLEMLGGYNANGCYGEWYDWAYYINENGYIVRDFIDHIEQNTKFIIYTLEEFEEKFPYKVGDKVYYQPIPQINSVCISEIISMKWIDGSVVYYTSNGHEVYVCDLHPYKEETIKESIDKTNKAIFKDMKEIKIDIPEGYEFFGIDDDNKIVLTEKQPQYPKTYEECFNICFGNHYPVIQVIGLDNLGNNKELFENFIKLKICRDTYWKIAGEELGLNKPWEPDWCNGTQNKYCIYNKANSIQIDSWYWCNKILAFPTKEMCDTFYKNFKKEIEQCKELL